MIRSLPRIVLIGCACLTAARGAESPLIEARSTLEKWMETRQLISRTKTDWQADKEIIEQTCELLERELKSLDEQFGKLGTNTTQVEAERLQANAVLKASEETLAEARHFAEAIESRVRMLVPQLPAPLQDQIKPLLNRMPVDGTGTKAPATERMQVVVGLLNELDKFNSAVSVFSEKRKDEKGEELAVETVYVGLGAAYFASDSGKFAGTGTSTPDGWQWKAVPEIGSAVKEVIRIYRNERPPRFIALPALIR